MFYVRTKLGPSEIEGLGLFDEEKQALEAHNALDNFVLVDLYKNPHDLKTVLQSVQRRSSADQTEV